MSPADKTVGLDSSKVRILAAFAIVLAIDGLTLTQGSELRFTNLVDRAVVLPIYGDTLVSTADFSGDGRADLLIGGNNPQSLDKTPLVLLINDGGGAFHDATSEFIEGTPAAASPVSVTADFNADGRPDVAVFDAGNAERGQDPTGGFYGESPLLLLSNATGRWTVSTALADAALAINTTRFGAGSGSNLHAKNASAADIDGDGDIDIFVESGGGYRNVSSHFLINSGNATFTPDTSAERLTSQLRGVPSDQWRYATNALADLNDDGRPDLVLGQLRRPRNQQEGLASRVVLNDGAGRFKSDRIVDLPYAAFFDGWTTVNSIVVADINGDDRPDILMAHVRSQDDQRPDEPQGTGRFIQIMVADGQGRFLDETAVRMGDQSATMAARTADYGNTPGTVKGLELVDIDGDGDLDLMAGKASAPVGPHGPLFYVNDGSGIFRAMDPVLITNSQTWFGEMAVSLDMNGDNSIDFVHSDLLPGADGGYGTGDERSRIIATLGRR
jgi:hypothetical protein